jgi:signal transduction histidine kinase/CheY-like chemotaxis protein
MNWRAGRLLRRVFGTAVTNIILFGLVLCAPLCAFAADAGAVFTGHWGSASESRIKSLIAERSNVSSEDIEAAAALDLAIYYAVGRQAEPLQSSTEIAELGRYLAAPIGEGLKADLLTAVTLKSLRDKDLSGLMSARARYHAQSENPLGRYALAYGYGRILQSLALHGAAHDVFTDILTQEEFQSLAQFSRDHADILLRLSDLALAQQDPKQALNHAKDAALAYHYFVGQNDLKREDTSYFRRQLALKSAAAFAGVGDIETAAQKADTVLQDGKAVHDYPVIFAAGILLGELAVQKGDFAAALSRFRDVRESPYFTAQNPLGARLYDGLAAANEGQGRLARALEMFKYANQNRAQAERDLSAKRSLYLSSQTISPRPLTDLPIKYQGDIGPAGGLSDDVQMISGAPITLSAAPANPPVSAQSEALKHVNAIILFGGFLAISGLLIAGVSFIRLRQARRELEFSHEKLQNSQQRERDSNQKSQEDLRALKFADEAKKAFLANVSHEIRTPMSGVLGLADVLRRTTRLGARQQEIVDTIYHSSQGVVSLLGDVLDYSKIESGTFELNISQASVRVMAENVAALMCDEARQKNIEILIRCAPDLPETLPVDIGRLRQVLINLVQNAVKFTEKGYVIINVDAARSEDDMRLKIQVLDTGIGISDADQPRLFDDFFQLDQGRSRKYGGTGLGLSISKKLMQAMEGDLTVRSQLGKGSVFTLELKIELPAKMPLDNVAPVAPIFASGRVLVIDHLSPRLKIMSAQLKHWGLSCRTTQRPKDAIAGMLAAARGGNAFDAVIIDAGSLGQPSTGTQDFIAQMKSEAELSDLPIILLQHLTQIRAEDSASVTEKVAKPVRSDALLQALKSHMQTHLSPEAKVIDGGAPLRQKRPRPIAAAPRPERNQSRILIAEAETAVRHVMKNFLEDKSIELHTARDGEEALEAAKTIDFDIIFMDVQLRKLDGFLVTRALRAFEKETDADRTPVICLSAYALGADEQLAKIVGMDDFLVKPLSHDSLDIMVTKWAAIKADLRAAKAAQLKAEKRSRLIDPMVKPLKTKPAFKAA